MSKVLIVKDTNGVPQQGTVKIKGFEFTLSQSNFNPLCGDWYKQTLSYMLLEQYDISQLEELLMKLYPEKIEILS